MPKINIQTQKNHIKKFEKEQHKYITYANVLKQILEKSADIYAPLGVVQARAKSISSFSEKIIRKDKYVNPLEEVTDLCGARMICHFADQVLSVCKFIRENFEVDELNSLDVKSRLNVSEFGYRSVHFIVTPRQAKILGVDIPYDLWSLKAEIQVRTFNEHIWADVFHDRIYKTPINIPSEWKREAARLAAILENADNAFSKMSGIIDQLTVNYSPTPPPDRFNNEKEILYTLIEIQEDINDKTIVSRLNLVKLLHQEGKWDEITELLNPVLNEVEKLTEVFVARVNQEYGFALCSRLKNENPSNDFGRGISCIEKAISIFEKLDVKKELARAWHFKGTAIKMLAVNNEAVILEAFDKAHQLLNENPYYYLDFLIQDIEVNENYSFDIDLVSSRLRSCISDCNEHVEAGIEGVQAFFVIIKAGVLLNDSVLVLNTYLKLIDTVLHDKVIYSKDVIYANIKDINAITHFLSKEKESVELLGHLLLWKKYNDENSLQILQLSRKNPQEIKNEVLIIAGEGVLNQNMMNLYRPFLVESLRDFKGTVISGGTNTGIPGLVGNCTNHYSISRNKEFDLLGYCPEELSGDIGFDNNYDMLVKSENKEFSFYDVIMYWLDVLFSNVKTDQILVLGFGGGAISLLEYKMGLAMDVPVALLKDSGRATTAIQNENYWMKKSNILITPDDPFTFWALTNRNKSTVLLPEETDMLARQIHSFYLGLGDLKNENQEHFKAVKDWEWNRLDMKLKDSNFKQAGFIEHLLKRVDLNIKKSESPELFLIDERFGGYHILAQLEHARWNAERLLSGWKLGTAKDVNNKISPYIKRWELIPDDIKKYDYKAVERFPEMLREMGYAIIETGNT